MGGRGGNRSKDSDRSQKTGGDLKKFHRAIWMVLLARAWEALLLTRGGAQI